MRFQADFGMRLMFDTKIDADKTDDAKSSNFGKTGQPV